MNDLREAMADIIDPFLVRNTVGHIMAREKADAILALFAARGLAVVPEEAPEHLRRFSRVYREYIKAAKVSP